MERGGSLLSVVLQTENLIENSHATADCKQHRPKKDIVLG